MKTLRKLLILALVLSSFSVFAQAQADEDPQYQIQSVTIEEVEASDYDFSDKVDASSLNQVGAVIEVIDKLMAIGERVWRIVDSGKPVLTTDRVAPSISVLPRAMLDSGSLYEMYGWTEPVVKSYKISYKNMLNVTIVDFKFSVMLQYNGTDGKGGVYISGLSVVPDSVDVAWGWNFNAETRLINISNMGTMQNPVAAATMELAYQVKSPLSNIAKRVRFFVTGQGKVKMLN